MYCQVAILDKVAAPYVGRGFLTEDGKVLGRGDICRGRACFTSHKCPYNAEIENYSFLAPVVEFIVDCVIDKQEQQ